MNGRLGYSDWKELYKKLTFWDLELEKSDDSMTDILHAKKRSQSLIC